MQRNPIDVVVTLFQYFAVPFQIGPHEGTAGAASNELERVIHIAHLAGGVGSLQSVLRRGHMADLPRTVHLIAKAPMLHIVRIRDTVLAAQITPARSFLHVAIFDQSSGVFRRACAKIQAHEGRGSNSAAPGHEFVSAKLIGFDGIPGLVQHARAVFLWPDAIQPVVSGYEIASRIANSRFTEMFHFLGDIFAETVGIGKFRSGIVNTTVNRAAQMFEERPEEVAVKRRECPARIQINTCRASCDSCLP